MAPQTRRALWSPRSWSRIVFLAAGIPVQAAVPCLVVGMGFARPRVVWSLVFLVLMFFLVPVLTWIQRHRLRVTAGIDIPPQPGIPGRLSRDGIVIAGRARSTWRQLSYHLVVAPLLAAAALAAIGFWLAGALYTLTYTYAWRLNQDSLLWRGRSAAQVQHLPNLLGVPIDLYLTAGGLVLLILAPTVTGWVSSLDGWAARELLGPSRAEELEHRVAKLAKTRAGVVDAADAERRRLERDLHDGTQQRLVSLAMNLGMARAQTGTVDEAREAIAEAHEEAKAALTELRNLVRGLHPAVLEDRGLDAALSGVAARMRIPVKLTVDVPRRPSPTIEAVAYFVVSEGLTNITKHAQASQAEVYVQRTSDRLHIIVSDDGVGGADASRGTGLAGLAKRAESVDGTFEIVSPPGGPTLLTVDLPCAR
jgi:signal transduction histidine kinase